MPKIVVEHEDVGAWKLVNSSFLRQRLYCYTPGRKRRPVSYEEEHGHGSASPPGSPGPDLPHQEGLVFFTPQDVKEMNNNPDHPHGAIIEDILTTDEEKRSVSSLRLPPN